MTRSYRKTRKSYDEPGHAHFLTYSCRKRWPLLTKDRSRQWIIDALERSRERLGVRLWAYVIMPEHVHVLLFPTNSKYKMRRILASLKAPVSRRAKEYLQQTENEKWLKRLTVRKGDKDVFRFWQPGGGYDENLWNEWPIREIIDYIHANPVRRGLVERPTDWHWSSARAHAELDDCPLMMDQVDIG